MNDSAAGEPPAPAVARAIAEAFVAYHDAYRAMTRRAGARFARREWREAQEDMRERLALYRRHMDALIAALGLGAAPPRAAWWEFVRAAYAGIIAVRPDAELAETWFNSLARRLLPLDRIDATQVFEEEQPRRALAPADGRGVRSYPLRRLRAETLLPVLRDLPLEWPLADAAGDAARVAAETERQLTRLGRASGLEAVEMLPALFYRNKGAYAVGRLRAAGGLVPFVLPIVHDGAGVRVDAVLTIADEVSAVFGFTRSYFFADLEHPAEVVRFLRSILPLRQVHELYTAIGYEKHGKTELYRELQRHLARPDARLELAEGDRGMVMSVFTLPSLNVVFKVIKDRFDYPKQTTRQKVREKYDLVFQRDRVGRLADAQEFEHLVVPRASLAPDLLEELGRVAARTVQVEGDRVRLRHLYTERRVTPLNLFLQRATPRAAASAVVDYGWAIKDLAAANIFPGDMLLKNFGVTRHGRVVFYDYDELCLLVECHFRRMPPARSDDDEYAAEPWFAVQEHDVFPEEFDAFLSLGGKLGETFRHHHADLSRVEFWLAMQERQRQGEMPDFFPYKVTRRLRRD